MKIEPFGAAGEQRAIQGVIANPRPNDHVSDWIVCLRKTFIIRVMGQYSIPPETLALFDVGLAWENLLAPTAPEGTTRHPGLVLDGIIGTPDWVEGGRIWESKATWSSSNRGPEAHWEWFVQIGAYLYMARLRPEYIQGEAGLAVLWVNGNYAPPAPRGPDRYRVSFTPRELEEHWQTIVSGRNMVERALAVEGPIPPMTVDKTRFCPRCPVKGVCDRLGARPGVDEGWAVLVEESDKIRAGGGQ
ncbi:MAG: PD-(D/E)XK nuclease family protein [Chloroflexota bacterium]|nr:PD-(D/E)XK nuclease family protein [Chloroflexota bacterium]